MHRTILKNALGILLMAVIMAAPADADGPDSKSAQGSPVAERECTGACGARLPGGGSNGGIKRAGE